MLWHMSSAEWMISFGFIACFTYIVGWCSDSILGNKGFGHFGNWFVLLIGAYTGMYGFNLYGYQFHWYPVFTLLIVSSVMIGLFVSACLIKLVVLE